MKRNLITQRDAPEEHVVEVSVKIDNTSLVTEAWRRSGYTEHDWNTQITQEEREFRIAETLEYLKNEAAKITLIGRGPAGEFPDARDPGVKPIAAPIEAP